MMKKNRHTIEVSDLDVVAHFGEDLALYIFSEDKDIPTTLCVQANFDTLQFDPVQPMGYYLQHHAYEPIQDEDTRISYRQRILEEMNPEKIVAMLSEFSDKHYHGVDIPNYLINFRWQPGG